MIRDLWRAWKEVRNKRHLAKESLELINSLYICIKERKHQIFKCYDDLGKIYSYLPKDSRQDYVQKTLDLLNFSGSGWAKQTTYSFYKKLYEDIDYKRDVVYDHWRRGDYEKVIEICGQIISDTDRKIDEYIKGD